MRREFDHKTVGSAQGITAANVRGLRNGKPMTGPASAPVRVIIKGYFFVYRTTIPSGIRTASWQREIMPAYCKPSQD